MKTKPLLSYLCVSTVLCSFAPMAWGMDDDNKNHFFLIPSKEKQKPQVCKEGQEKNRKKLFHKLTGRSLTIQLLGEETRFYEDEVASDGDCGYSSLDINRHDATQLLLENLHREEIRHLVAPEIYDMLPQLPKNHPVMQLQGYKLNLGQEVILAEPYQKICTSLNDHFKRPENDRWSGDQLWQYCEQNLNTIRQNLQQNQSYETFKSLREQIEQNEEERMRFCSQQGTVGCYIKNFMQVPVGTYFNQYGENNWLNYSPICMSNGKYRTYAINAIAQLLGKNLIILDEESNIKHHYLCSKLPIEKDNTLFLLHIGNYHFNKLIYLEKDEAMEYLNFLRPKPILIEEIQDNFYKTIDLPPSPFDLIHCPTLLDDGLKDLQQRLREKIVLKENKLKILKTTLIQAIKNISSNDLKNQLKEFISPRYTPRLMGESPSIGYLGELKEKEVGVFLVNDDIFCKIHNKDPIKILKTSKNSRKGLSLACFERVIGELKQYTLRLMSKNPSEELLKEIKEKEVGIFFKEVGFFLKDQDLYLKIYNKEPIRILRPDNNYQKFPHNFNSDSFDRISKVLKEYKNENITQEDETLLLEFIKKNNYLPPRSIKKEDAEELLKIILLNGYTAFLSFPEELVLDSKSSLGLKLGKLYAQNQEKDILSHPAFESLDYHIKLCENLAKQFEVQNIKEVGTTLWEIKTIYEEYKKEFLIFNPKKLEEEYEKHLAPKVEFYGTLLSPSLIPQSLAHKLASLTLLNQPDKKNKDGTHPVYSFEDSMHFKAYDHGSEFGLSPGKELAMYHLYRHLIGGGVAPSTLCLIELPFVDVDKVGIRKETERGQKIETFTHKTPHLKHYFEVYKKKKLCPIQASTTIKGIEFHRFLQNHFFAEWKENTNNLNKNPEDYLYENSKNSFVLDFQERFRDKTPAKNSQEEGLYKVNEKEWNEFLKAFNSKDWLFDRIDVDSFARMTLMSFLTDPGDAKADNFMLYRKNDNDKWLIVSIDTDRIFEPNFKKFRNGNKIEKHQVHHKSIFYTLPFFMTNSAHLSDKVKDEFKKINVPVALARWLFALREENKAYSALQKESALPERIYAGMQLPITFKKGQITTLLSRLETLQKIFCSNQNTLTLDDVFKKLHPLLHASYQKIQEKYPDDPLTMIYASGMGLDKLLYMNKVSEVSDDDQELAVESLFSEKEFHSKDEEGRSFASILEAYNEVEGDTKSDQPTLVKDESLQTIDEALEELFQLPKTLFEIGKDILKQNESFPSNAARLENIVTHKNYNPSTTDEAGDTLLHYWVRSSFTDCEMNRKEETRKSRKQHLQKFLMLWGKCGGTLDDLNKRGESILDRAFQHRREELVKLLLQSKKETKKEDDQIIKEENIILSSLPYYEKNLEFFYHKVKEKNPWKISKNKNDSLRALFRAKKAKDPYFRWTLQRSKIFTLIQQGNGEKVEIITRNPGQMKLENQMSMLRFEVEMRYLTFKAQTQLWRQNNNTFQAIHENKITQRKVGRVIFDEDKILKDIETPKEQQKVRHSRIYFKQNPSSAGTALSIMELETALFGAPSLPMTFAKIKGAPFTLSPGIGRLVEDTSKNERMSYFSLKKSWTEEGNLHKILETEDPKLKTYPLSLEALGQSIVIEIITNPEDGKPSNYILEKIKDKNSYKVTNIDTEQAFVPSVKKPPKELEGYIVEAKSILYCLNQMTTLLPPILIQKIQAWNSIEMMKEWVISLDQLNQMMRSLFTEKEHIQLEKQLSPVGIPFGKGEMGRLIRKLLKLQSFSIEENMTFMGLLQKVEPFIADRYVSKISEELKDDTPFKRFDKIDGPTYDQNRPFLEQIKTKIVSKKDYQSSVSSRVIAIARGLAFDPKGALKEIKKEFVNYMAKEMLEKLRERNKKQAQILGKILNVGRIENEQVDEVRLNFKDFFPHQQTLVFEALKPLKLKKLVLKYSNILKSDVLKQFRWDNIIKLDLTGCMQIDSSLVNHFSDKCHNLEELILNRCFNLEYVAGGTIISVPLSFPKLQKAFFNQCEKLNQLNIKADQLQLLEAQNNPNLSIFKVQSKTLKTVNVSKNPKIMDKVLDDLGEACPLTTIICKECPQISFPEFRQHWSFATQKTFEKERLEIIKPLPSKFFTQFQLPTIVELNLTECKELNLDVLTLIVQGCSSLEILNVSACNTLSAVVDKRNERLSFNLLNIKHFFSNQCPILHTFDVIANRLETLEAQSNPKLGRLEIYSSTLKTLYISRNPKITDKMLDGLKTNCPNLETFFWQGCSQLSSFNQHWSFALQKSLNKSALQSIKKVYEQKLTSLCLWNYKNIGIEEAKALAQNTTLTEMDLRINKIGDEGAKALAQNTTLTSLDLQENSIGDEGAKALAQNTTLTSLDLGHNNIGDEGTKALAQNTTLTSLKLWSNKIGEEGAKAFQYNTTLTELSLSINKIGDEGAKALAQNTTLTSLDLGHNNIGDEGAKALAQNTTLRSLDLEDNKIGNEGIEVLKQSTILTKLNQCILL